MPEKTKFQFMITKDKQKQKGVTFEELESANICRFCFEMNDFND